ncbi:uncharacterized protein LOC132042892 [Lycium ferocissimum]|uniref:uncharacterized protein LOC132042892 n=1 Tax=Lycium ferocissimum TaxID=112874 RepID=UPI002815486E|nr:uncharacterized protein LOC132042892 [Lycium ferocissimum]
MSDSITIGVDCHGEWIEKNNRYIWRWKGSDTLETIVMSVQRDVVFDDFVNLIITYCELTSRPILRVYVVGSPVENHNLSQDQQDVLNNELDGVDMDIPDNGSGVDQIPIPEVASNIVGTTQSIQSSHVQDDETSFYKGICVHPEYKWWLRAVKLLSSDRFCIRTYIKNHACGSEHITSHNPHASAKVIGEYFKDKFPYGKGPSTKDINQSIHIDLGCKVSYWKVWKGMEIIKALTRETHEHEYAVLDAYPYMLRSANPGSKTALKVDENGKFKYFFVAYKAWMLGFAQMKKVIAFDGTFLRSKYKGVLLSAVAQDAENHIFPVAFCVVDKECDASYKYFFEQMRSYIEDTPELCIISERHPRIKKAVSFVFPTCHYGFCMRHLGKNLRTTFHNGAVVSQFYKTAKAYNIDVFNDHFNQMKDLVPGAAEHLERAGFHRWSRAFCPGNRYKFMTTNAAESVNSMFNVERELPITALFDSINRSFRQVKTLLQQLCNLLGFSQQVIELVAATNLTRDMTCSTAMLPAATDYTIAAADYTIAAIGYAIATTNYAIVAVDHAIVVTYHAIVFRSCNCCNN